MPALVDVLGVAREQGQQLFDGERAVGPEQGHGDQRRGSDRSDGVDAHRHLERELLQRDRVGLALLDGLRELAGEVVAHRDRLAEPDVDVAAGVARALRPRVAHEPGERLGCLGRALHRPRMLFDVEQLVVDDRHRLEHEVVAAFVVHRVDEVGEQSEPRVAQLAGAGATAFDVPLEVLAVLGEPADVLAQRELVHRVVAEAAADEDEAGAAPHRTHGPERHVDAAELVGRRQAGALQHRRQHHRVDVGAVAREQRDGVAAVQVLEGANLVGVDLDPAAVPGAVEEPGDVQEHVAHGTAVRRHHLAQVGVELGRHVMDRASRVRGDLAQSITHLGPAEDRGTHGRGAHRGTDRGVPRVAHNTGQFASVSR